MFKTNRRHRIATATDGTRRSFRSRPKCPDGKPAAQRTAEERKRDPTYNARRTGRTANRVHFNDCVPRHVGHTPRRHYF